MTIAHWYHFRTSKIQLESSVNATDVNSTLSNHMLKKAVVKIQSDDFMTLRGSQRIDDSETEIKNQSRPNSGSSSSSSTSSTGKLAIE